MKDVTGKYRTFREAVAEATIVAGDRGMEALRERSVPKGDPLEIGRSAAFSGVKKTDELIPHCHNLPVENCSIEYELDDEKLTIEATVSSVARTGMEMEALTAASVASLTIYDLLKPIEDDVEVRNLRLLEKKGGKSDFRDRFQIKDLSAAVVTTSDGAAEGHREDRSGQILQDHLSDLGFLLEEYEVLPDEREQIQETLRELVDRDMDFIATTGGTGPGPRDVTVEATREVLDREIPGIIEAMRSYGQERTPYAMFSRGLSGQADRTLIINFPGSSSGTREGLEAITPGILHFFKMRGTPSGGH